MNPFNTHEVVNSDGNVLRFTGELVAQVSSEVPEKDRWTEFRLYLSDFDTWILQIIGRSRVPGETDRFRYIMTSEPGDWIDQIVGPDVSRLAKKLLRDAFAYLKNCESDEDVPVGEEADLA